MKYLKIDGQSVIIDQKINPAITVGVADIQEPENSSSGYAKTVEVPFEPSNVRIFGFTNELFSKDKFNNEMHTAEYMDDDTTVMYGVAQIEKFTYITDTDGRVVAGSFHVSVIGASYEWITSARKQINELTSNEKVIYTMDDVYRNSIGGDATLIKFFPVDRGAFWKENTAGKMIPRTKLDLYDYHPFINVWGLLELIFKGHTLHSSISEKLKPLFFSGYMPKTDDLSEIKEENDFACGSSYIEQELIFSGVGSKFINLFDDWKSDGYFVATEGILSVPQGSYDLTVFKPTESLPVSFNIELNYSTTIHQGAFIDTFDFGSSRFVFKFGFWDSIEAQNNDILEIPNLNTGSDYLGNFRCPDYKKYKSLRLWYSYSDRGTRVQGDEEATIYIINEISASELCFRCNIPSNAIEYRLYLEGESGKLYNASEVSDVQFAFMRWGDLAGVGSDAYLTFEKKIATPVVAMNKGEIYRFISILSASQFDHTPSKGVIRLGIKTCEINPNFRNAIGLGDEVGIETIGGTGTQLDFLAALRQMFNLMFYTNPLTKEVYIEPRTAFYKLDRTCVVDWRGKIDRSKEIIIEELGGDVGNSLKLAYAEGTDVVKRYNWKNKTELGAYSMPLLNKISDEPKEIINPIFSPFLLRIVESVGMAIPQNEPEKTQDQIEEVDLDITPIIGHFTGIGERTSGEELSKYGKYPQLAFQSVADNVNLGFDDIQSLPVPLGQNQYYQDNISAYNNGRRITLYLHLASQDVEALLLPNDQMQDLRAVFLLEHDGEDIPCLLESVSDYNPGNGTSTKCQFIFDPNIRLFGKESVVISYNGVSVSYGNTVIKYEEKE